ncbi:unnamed protein product, partial [Rotaria sp. Silwood1]
NDLSSHEEKVNELSKYLPLRFLICMISAIANPFLYGYFNETFKDGLEKIFSLCCRHMNRRLNEIRYTQSNNRIPEITLKRKQNGSLVSKSSSYQLSLYKSSNNDVSIRPSTRLTKTNQNHLSISMSSAN